MQHDPRPSSVIDIRTTEILLRRAQAGDQTALSDLFQRYEDRILRFARAKVGPKLSAKVEIEDILQEVRLRAWKDIGSFDPRHAPRLICWLGEITKNCIQDEVKKWSAQKRDARREVAVEDMRPGGDGSGSIPIASMEATPSQNGSAQELAEIYDRCVHSLSERHREVVLLKHYADMSWEDISARIGTPNAKAAFQLHSRAMEALTEKLRQEGFSLPGDGSSA